MSKIYSDFIEVSIPQAKSIIKKEEVDEFLVLYPEEKRIVKDFHYSNGNLMASLIPKKIEYSTANPDYYTAEQLLTAFSQMGYLLGGLAIKDPNFIGLDSSCLNIYKEKIINLQCYYLNFNMKFLAKVLKSKSNTMCLKLTHTNNSYTKLIANMEAEIHELFAASATLIYK